MRFEKAIYADGFCLGEKFLPTEDFEPLSFTLKDDDCKVLEQAVASLSIHSSDFAGLALTSRERKIEQELKDRCGLILTGRKEGWYLLGIRMFREKRKPGSKAEFYVLHVISQLNFIIKLDEKVLPHFTLESRFMRVIDDMLNGRFLNN